MNDFELKEIFHLMAFPDLWENEAEYMSEHNALHNIELGQEALYKNVIDNSMLFTPKLRYMCRTITNHINYQIKQAIELIETQHSKQLTKNILKINRERVITLTNYAREELSYLDPNNKFFPNTSTFLSGMRNEDRSIVEKVIFYHLMISELGRCLLELQDRYSEYNLATVSYDVSLFYGSCAKMNPDSAFMLQENTAQAPLTKKGKTTRTDCSFYYVNQENLAIAVQAFTNKLKQYNLIDDSVDYLTMISLFEGKSCRIKITWQSKNRHYLADIFRQLCNKNNPILIPWPKGTTHWKVVENRFVDENGNPLKNIRTESSRKRVKSSIDDIVSTLKGNL